MFGLLINPQPQRDESLLGYLQRLAGANGLTGNELIKAFQEASDEDVTDWFCTMTLPVSWSPVSCELRRPKTKTLKVWSLQHKRFCSCCLAESAYWKESWDLTLVTSCSVHGVPLQDRCPGCSAKMNRDAMLANSCKTCGYFLTSRSAPVAPAEDARAWMTAAMEARLRQEHISGGNDLAVLTYEQLHALSTRLAVRIVRSENSKPLKLANSGSLEISRELAQAAGEILMNWPRAFGDLLSDLRSTRSTGMDWKLASAFGPIYRDIYHDLQAPCFAFVRAEFESFVQQAWEAPLARRNRYLSENTIADHRWVSINEATRLTGLLKSCVQRLHDHGELASREIVHSSGRKSKVVDVIQLRELALLMQKAVNLRQAAKLLHINLERVRQLITGGILKFYGGKPNAGEKWLIDVDSLNGLRLERTQEPPGNTLVTVNYLAKHHLPTGRGLVEMIEAIQSGELKAFRDIDESKAAIGHWLLRPQDLAGWVQHALQKSSDFPGISVAKAAALLGVKEEVAYAMVRLGILWSTSVRRGRGTLQLVKPAAIERFRRRYILGPELAVFLGMSPKHITHHLWTNGFRPVAGPSIVNSPCRQYVWPRSKKLVDYLSWKLAHH
ncbi:TniQ family protein [Pseudomonas gingeri]|uniref:TniQ family protein n=1 Tax=Pseudomonas gingeri TaxID=117681 RepID=UPI0015A4C96D|nr:TniQ family protein [Pseudomonas gingeri]NWD74045.1 TniQ family protein [Pseudomonas gingeri]